MAADLKISGLVHRSSVVVISDALAVLDHEGGKDRVRRILFGSIESVLVWRVVPWIRVSLLAVLLGLPGLLLPLTGTTPGYVMSGILLGLAAILISLNLYCGKTTVRVVHHQGASQQFTVIARRGRVERFVTKLAAGITAAQAQIKAANPAGPPAPSAPPAPELFGQPGIARPPGAQTPPAVPPPPPPPPAAV